MIAVLPGAGVEKRQAPTAMTGASAAPALPGTTRLIGWSGSVSSVRSCWAPLPLKSDGPIGFASPYAQVVYAAKHGVLVNTGNASCGTSVMRPDLSKVKWK